LDLLGTVTMPSSPLTHHGVDAGDVTLTVLQPPVAFELAGGRLETEVEELFLRLLQLGDQLVLGWVRSSSTLRSLLAHLPCERSGTSSEACGWRG
jgi:hypothetical protein